MYENTFIYLDKTKAHHVSVNTRDTLIICVLCIVVVARVNIEHFMCAMPIESFTEHINHWPMAHYYLS